MKDKVAGDRLWDELVQRTGLAAEGNGAVSQELERV